MGGWRRFLTLNVKAYSFALLVGWCSVTAYGADAAQVAAPAPGQVTYEAPGLALVFGEDASVESVISHGKSVPLLSTAGGFEVAEYDGAAKGARTLKPTAAVTSDGFVLSYEEGALTLAVNVEELPGHIALHGRLQKSAGPDRAFTVSFALPVNAWGWNWWDDPARVRRIDYGVEYSNYGFLGEDRDIPVSRMPFAAIADNAAGAGVAFAVPLDQPRIFRFNYSTTRGLRAEFNLGLSSATENFPDRADFTILIYAADPVWGLRSAAETYYGLFPEAYARRLPRDGVSTWRITEEFMPPADYIEKWGIAFRWTSSGRVQVDAAFMQYLRDNGIIALRHREPWARWHLVYPYKDHPWYDQFPERRRDLSKTPQQPPHDEELAMLVEETRAPQDVKEGNDQIPGPVCEVSQATLNCLVYDENDRPRIGLWHKWSAGG
mgnify:CR=1 FL=1